MEQIGVHKPHGALAGRRGKTGVVTDLGSSRVNVLFDGEDIPVGVRPHLLQVLAQQEAEGMTCLEGLHWHGYLHRAEGGLYELPEPTLLDRKIRLAEVPHTVLRSPSQVAKWVGTTSDQDECFVLWLPAPGLWRTYADQAEWRTEAVKLAARAGAVYTAVSSADGSARCELYAEAVSADDCPEHGVHHEQDA
ncbi:hypothetical protein ADL03_15595 [Nocardia sp. NRRL S-836]|nr:hypothetical protein ADL03_15595 [Nocardia sp. NRRL S-836]